MAIGSTVYAISQQDKISLTNRADKICREFDLYPLMPEGDDTVAYMEQVVNFNPLFVLDTLENNLVNILLEKINYKYNESCIRDFVRQCIKKHQNYHAERILQILKNNFYRDIVDVYKTNKSRHQYQSFESLRRNETKIFYYSYSIYYLADLLNDVDNLRYARRALSYMCQLECKRGYTSETPIKTDGLVFSIEMFSREKALFEKLAEKMNSSIRKFDIKEKNEWLDELIKKEQNSIKSNKSKRNITTLCRVISPFLVPVFLYLYTTMVDFDFDEWIIMVSALVSILSGLIINVKYKKLPITIIGTIVSVVIFYPMCWVVSFLALYSILLVILLIAPAVLVAKE